MVKRILFYSSVKDKSLFYIQKFYLTDITILKDLGYEVILSNRILDALKFWKYDILFSYFYKYSFFPSFIAKIFGKRRYFTGGIDNLNKDTTTKIAYCIQKFFFILCYSISTKCIIVSNTDMKNACGVLKFWKKKLAYSEHTINLDKFRPTCRAKEKLCITIGWQGDLSNVKRKGMDKAIILFSKLVQDQEFSDYKLYIIGQEGVGTQYLKSLVDQLSLQNKVSFKGEISEEDKIAYLDKSYIYFQLSSYEGFGIAAIEALSMKNIIIHSGRGGLSNPIFEDCILFDLDSDFGRESSRVCNELHSYDLHKLSDVSSKLNIHYNDDRRKKDLKNIINIQ